MNTYAIVCAFLIALFSGAACPGLAQPVAQTAVTITQPVNPAMFPMLGEENRVFGYWLWSRLIDRTTVGSWSLVNNTWMVAPGNVNTANIQFSWQEGSAIPGLAIYVDSDVLPPENLSGTGSIRAGGQSFSFDFSASSVVEAENLTRTVIEVTSVSPCLEALVAAMQSGQTLRIETGEANMVLAFSLKGFAEAWQMAQE